MFSGNITRLCPVSSVVKVRPACKTHTIARHPKTRLSSVKILGTCFIIFALTLLFLLLLSEYFSSGLYCHPQLSIHYFLYEYPYLLPLYKCPALQSVTCQVVKALT